MNQTLFVFFVLLATSASIGSALRCYDCSKRDSSDSEICGDPFGSNPAVRITTCPSRAVCIKQGYPKLEIDGKDNSTIIRACGIPSWCQIAPSEIREFCHSCSEDLCNSAVTIIPSIGTVIVLYFIKLTFL